MDFEPTPIIELITYSLYYGLLLITSLTGLFGVYILTKHGESRTFSIILSLIYIILILLSVAKGQSLLSLIF